MYSICGFLSDYVTSTGIATAVLQKTEHRGLDAYGLCVDRTIGQRREISALDSRDPVEVCRGRSGPSSNRRLKGKAGYLLSMPAKSSDGPESGDTIHAGQ